VRPQKYLKIDLSSEYPCPCRRRGRLLPIVLTEAFGCDRCQQIFVVDQKNQIIEQLSSTYPYKPAWHWTGYRWIATHYRLGESGILPLIVIVLAVTIASMFLALRSITSIGMIFGITVVVVFILFLGLAIWLVYRH
jgi:amino acid transporter